MKNRKKIIKQAIDRGVKQYLPTLKMLRIENGYISNGAYYCAEHDVKNCVVCFEQDFEPRKDKP